MTLTIDRSETAAEAVAGKGKPRGGALDPFFEGLCFACATALMAALCWVLVSLFIGGWPALHKFGLNFLFIRDWNPVTEVYGATAGQNSTRKTAMPKAIGREMARARNEVIRVPTTGPAAP